MTPFTVFSLITKKRIFPCPTCPGLNPNSLGGRLPRSRFPARSFADSGVALFEDFPPTFWSSSLPELPTNFEFQVAISLLAISLVFASLQTESVVSDNITMNILIQDRCDKIAQTLTKVSTITLASLPCVCCSVTWESCSWDPFVCILQVIHALK